MAASKQLMMCDVWKKLGSDPSLLVFSFVTECDDLGVICAEGLRRLRERMNAKIDGARDRRWVFTSGGYNYLNARTLSRRIAGIDLNSDVGPAATFAINVGPVETWNP
jgi:hypothetical protein